MPLKLIELECPGCNERLELDAGFAGGVCRCHHCGTLMTVPTNPDRDGAEQLMRPDRPGGQMRRPSRPGDPSSQAAAAPARPESPLAVQPDSSGDVYTTASGRVVRVDDDRGIPTARKRQVARYTTYAVFIAAVAALVAAAVVVAWIFAGNGPTT